MTDSSRELLARVMGARRKAGFHVRVTNIPDREAPFDYYAANDAQRDSMIRRAKSKGYSVEII